MKSIAIIDQGYNSYDYEKKVFKENGYTLKLYPGNTHDIESKIKFAQKSEGLLVRGTKISTSFLEKMPYLRAIVRYGVGYDNINLDAATARGIKVANVQGYANQSVSDHALMFIFSCTRGFGLGQKIIHNQFSNPPIQDIFELHDKTLGIIGLGRIGTALCKKAKHLFHRIIAVDPYVEKTTFAKYGVVACDLKTLLKESDIISIHCNLTHETFHMLDTDAFLAMEKRPVIINTARGAIINEKALLVALEKNRVHSAGLDVFENEPIGDKQKQLLAFPRVLATGHYAWYSESSSLELQKRAAQNLIALLKGEKISDCLN